MNVLIVDDSEELLILLQAVLKKLGVQALCCTTAAEATSLRGFDLTLVDWNLEDGSGVDVLFNLRKSHPQAKLYLMSASKPDQAILNRLSDIHVFYEAKPLSPVRLKKLIEF